MPSWEKEADALHASGARHALILSKASDARGQIAEGIARALAPRQIRVSSAGVARGAVDPLAVRVLDELSVASADLQARTLDEIDVTEVGAIVVLSEEDPTPPALHGRPPRALAADGPGPGGRFGGGAGRTLPRRPQRAPAQAHPGVRPGGDPVRCAREP